MRKLFLFLPLLLLVGCSGITPYEPRNNREEGPPNGLFSGPEGEFTLQWTIGSKAGSSKSKEYR